ncbi:hypothetical protein HK104_006158 [Borealophlyctis nickersoniae]|nr:hypothetical protein HK104_006158 [Borealophlyctis nickersoniae]
MLSHNTPPDPPAESFASVRPPPLEHQHSRASLAASNASSSKSNTRFSPARREEDRDTTPSDYMTAREDMSPLRRGEQASPTRRVGKSFMEVEGGRHGEVDKRSLKRMKVHEAERKERKARMMFLEDAWDNSRFSDIKICCLNRMYRLHKVVLMHSPFFARLLLDDSNQELIIVEGFLSLECGGDHRITKEGMEICMHDLYDPDGFHRTNITPVNAFPVLASACFLELASLATYCANVILAAMNSSTVIEFASCLDRIRPPRDTTSAIVASPYGVAHEYWQLLAKHHKRLSEAVLSYLCQLVNVSLDVKQEDEESDEEWGEVVEDSEDGGEGSAAAAARSNQNRKCQTDPTDDVLSCLPLSWVRRVLESETLCVPTEFARYEVIKEVVEARRRRIRVKGEVDVEEAEALAAATTAKVAKRLGGKGGDTDGAHVIADGVSRLRNYFGSFLGNVIRGSATKGKRKRPDVSSDEEEGGPAAAGSSSGRATPKKLARTASTVRTVSGGRSGGTVTPVKARRRLDNADGPEDTVMAGIFQTAVVYTYMTFAQLEVVKKDGIVPDAVILQSFWAQAELTNCAVSGEDTQLPPFRFAARFQDVDEHFFGKKNGKRKGVAIEHGGTMDREEDDHPLTDTMMSSAPIVCAGVQYRVLLSLGPADDSDDDDETGLDNVENDENLSPADRRSSAIIQSYSNQHNQSRPRRHVVRALLQRSKSKAASSPHPSRGTAAARTGDTISYVIYAFDRGAFLRGDPGAWRKFMKPVTACDATGDGHLRGFPVPWGGQKNGESDLWLIVVIHFS